MIVFKYDKALIPKAKLYSTAKKLIPEIKKLQNAHYADDRASVCLPVDDEMIKVVQAAVKFKKRLNPQLIVVIGIGGSNLGTKAVQEAVNGKNWNLYKSPKILFADTIDPDELQVVTEEMKYYLRQGKQVLINLVTKSGSTTETIANFEVLLNVLKRHRKEAEKYVMVTTNKGSKLWDLGVKKGYSLLEIPEKVGGRYSVFSPVGLFPLGMLGIDIKQLMKGAESMLNKCLSLNYKKNPAAIGASLIYLHSNKRNIYNHFMFANDLESLGKWYRQLMGESVGKEFNVKGKRVNVGITPIVSVGSTDLHSMAQLFLGGPDDKLTNFVSTNFNNKTKIPNYQEFNKLVKDLQKKELNQIMRVILAGVKAAYRKQKRPYTETRLRSKDPEEIGEFMQLKMIEMMMLGNLLGVNPFDQPNVESYKKETRRILARG